MTAVRILLAVVVAALMVAVGLGLYMLTSSERYLHSLIETEGSQLVGAPIVAEEMELQLLQGEGRLEGVELGHPPGYRVHDGAAIEIDAVEFELDAGRSSMHKLVFRRVLLEGVRVNAIVRRPGESNMRALLENLDDSQRRAELAAGTEGRQALRFAVEELTLFDLGGSARGELSRRSVRLEPEDLRLDGIGAGPAGDDAPAGDVLERVLQEAITPLAQLVDDAAAANGLD